jgi:toxin CcdB
MARFDVCINLHRGSRERVPYLLEIQSDILTGLNTRLVAPLIPAAKFGATAERLNPIFRLSGKNHVMDTAQIAAIPAKMLGEKAGNLADHTSDILAAIDFLISGI